MRPEERDPAYLWDKLKAAKAIVDFTKDLSLEEFLAGELNMEMTRLAVERELEILGEASRRVSEPFCHEHNDIPWRQLVGLRNVISHEYDRVNYEEIFRIVRQRIPELIVLLEPLVPPPPKIDDT